MVTEEQRILRTSDMASGLAGSEILKIAAEIRSMTAEGRKICNLTVGDFSPTEFRIPQVLEEAIARQYKNGQTNYPPSDGVPELRKAVQACYKKWFDLDYAEKSVLVAGGARPLIYGMYLAVVDPGDLVVYPTPSWNNQHYVHMTGARGVEVPCHPQDSFLPTRELLKDKLRGARLLSLNSPLNPTGTAFSKEALTGICELVIEENLRRSSTERPLYIIYDHIYWMLTFGSTTHVNPVSLVNAIRPYVVFVDGISKAFAATGVRVGWAVGPEDLIERMSAIAGHVGAWAPRPEQLASAELLNQQTEIDRYHDIMKAGVQARLESLYSRITALGKEGHPVFAIEPMGAIYLTARFNLFGKTTPDGTKLLTNESIRRYLLQDAQLGIVPFQAFGHEGDTGWFRLSVGAVSLKDIDEAMTRLRSSLGRLS